jgi:hypothetical protein
MSPQPNRLLLAAMDAGHEQSKDERVEEEDNYDLTQRVTLGLLYRVALG